VPLCRSRAFLDDTEWPCLSFSLRLALATHHSFPPLSLLVPHRCGTSRTATRGTETQPFRTRLFPGMGYGERLPLLAMVRLLVLQIRVTHLFESHSVIMPRRLTLIQTLVFRMRLEHSTSLQLRMGSIVIAQLCFIFSDKWNGLGSPITVYIASDCP
jgi:hypothetical protein